MKQMSDSLLLADYERLPRSTVSMGHWRGRRREQRGGSQMSKGRSGLDGEGSGAEDRGR